MEEKLPPKAILIPFDNLTEKEQLDLLWTIFDFTNQKLPKDKMLPLILIPKIIKNDSISSINH
jgi:hypothetical protein